MTHPRRRYADKIFDALPGYLSVQDRQFRVIEANKNFRDDFGEYEGRHCYQVYKNRPEKCEDCPVERTFRDAQSHSSEEVVRTLNGREKSVIVYTTPILNDSGEIMEVLEMSTDITEIKQLQKQLQDSQQKYRDLFSEVPCFVSIQDKNLRIVDSNRLFQEAFGTFFGCKCFEVYKHRTEECYPCPVRQTFADGQVRMHEEVVTDRHGQQINVLVSTAPVKNADGSIENVIEMSTDITQIRQLQSKLASIGLLISSISHGLKGLLNSLDGGFYLVNSGFEKNNPDRVRQGWDIAQRNVERIKSMVLDILYYAKDREPNWELIDADKIISEICDLAKTRATKLGVEFKCGGDNNNLHFEADYKAVRALLVNLIENSFDACRVDSSKPSHTVNLELKDLDSHIGFEIRDNGIGMDRETKEKAFSLFFSSKGTEGTGLGLVISNKIAQEHGGSIEVESAINEGTTFLVKLPKKKIIKSSENGTVAGEAHDQ